MLMVATLETSDSDPKTYKQAMRLPDATSWLEACAAEVASLVENKVFAVVDRPASHQTITSKWVFKKQRGLTGAVEKYKARIVARGFMQEEGVDYGETYSPTVRFESIRMMLAAAASDGLHMEQLDVLTLRRRCTLRYRRGCFRRPCLARRSTWERCCSDSLWRTPDLPALRFLLAASSAAWTPLKLQQTRRQWLQYPTGVLLGL